LISDTDINRHTGITSHGPASQMTGLPAARPVRPRWPRSVVPAPRWPRSVAPAMHSAATSRNAAPDPVIMVTSANTSASLGRISQASCWRSDQASAAIGSTAAQAAAAATGQPRPVPDLAARRRQAVSETAWAGMISRAKKFNRPSAVSAAPYGISQRRPGSSINRISR